MSTQDVVQLNAKLDSFQKQFTSIAKTQDEILYKLSGNPLDKDDAGMIGELKEVKKEVDNLSEVKEDVAALVGLRSDVATLMDIRGKWKWAASKLVVGLGVLIGFVEFLFQYLFKS